MHDKVKHFFRRKSKFGFKLQTFLDELPIQVYYTRMAIGALRSATLRYRNDDERFP